ncbi:permease [Fructilactobacillus fructivorans]|uniref:DHA2 family efflux MFS transporter permease subunit n=1 Tax=Fructilactobacillus fructivorans TaxID=1614 RepID=UPI0007132B91|nr:DHA2 family efflux MFS transporter permease subunit [Fructilactobacillus fructivorans]KRN13188.1 permease [Fructilactobacillus fructivorans]
MLKTRKAIGFTGLILAMFMGALDATIVNIALPKIMTSFNTGLTDTTWVATIYVLSMAVFMITASKIADIYGRKIIMLIGCLLFGAFSFACMTATSLSLLILYRFIQGIGGAILTPIVLPMGIELFGKNSTSRVAATIGAFSALAAAGGPALGGFILNWSSWRWIFGINVPISIIAFLAIILGTKESYDHTISKKIDWIGMLLLTITMGGLTFGLLEGHQYGWSSPIIIGSFTAFILGLLLFIAVELKVDSPIIPLSLFKEATFTTSSIVYLIFGFAIIGPSLILNYFLQNVRNYSALHSAYLIIPASLAISISMPIATKMYHKLGAKLLIGIGLVISSGGLFMMAIINTGTPTANIVACNLIIGVGLGFTAISLAASVKFLPLSKNGIGSGVVNAARYVGQCLGMAILVTLLNANVNTAKNNIRHTAYNQIRVSVLSNHVKQVIHEEVGKTLKTSKDTKNVTSDQSKLKAKIKSAATDTKGLPDPKPKTSYAALYSANKKLSTGSQKLLNIQQLQTVLKPMIIGQNQMGVAIKLLAQKQQLTEVLNKVKHTKNHQLSLAFDNVFFVNGLVVLLCTPLAYWTDKKRKHR